MLKYPLTFRRTRPRDTVCLNWSRELAADISCAAI